MWESRILNMGVWNPEYGNLESGMRESGIAQSLSP
jgi:hypothetical protein